MNTILVTYATRAGSTTDVATAIAETLREEGAAVDVRPIKSVCDVQGYDAVVIGSAIRMGHWLPEAVGFVKTYRESLSRIPTAYFLVSGFLQADRPEVRKTMLAYLEPVRAMLEPVSIGLFAGKLDDSKLSWLDRFIAKKVGSAEGDWRDWQAIRQWARSLQMARATERVPSPGRVGPSSRVGESDPRSRSGASQGDDL